MRVIPMIVMSALLYCPAVLGQATPADSRTLQAILEEVHKLRQDLQATSATVERAQILLYRVRVQTDAVSRATARLDQARSELAQTKSRQTQLVSISKQQQDVLDQTRDPETHKRIQAQLEAFKNQLVQLAEQEPEAEAKEAECANQLRMEQGKLDELQDQLDRLDKKLESALTQPGQTR